MCQFVRASAGWTTCYNYRSAAAECVTFHVSVTTYVLMSWILAASQSTCNHYCTVWVYCVGRNCSMLAATILLSPRHEQNTDSICAATRKWKTVNYVRNRTNCTDKTVFRMVTHFPIYNCNKEGHRSQNCPEPIQVCQYCGRKKLCVELPFLQAWPHHCCSSASWFHLWWFIEVVDQRLVTPIPFV